MYQKQILRLTGAMVGGFVLGMGSQIFILPYVDSIAGFTVLFVAVTVLASWLATSSPRLSYAGVQLGLAFYLIGRLICFIKANSHLAVRLTLAAGEQFRVPLPLASLISDRFLALLARGGDSLDWSAISQIAAEESGQSVTTGRAA